MIDISIIFMPLAARAISGGFLVAFDLKYFFLKPPLQRSIVIL